MNSTGRGDYRGQSSLIGLVLVVGLVVAGTTTIVVFGTGILGDARADAQIDSAEHAMTKLDATASLVALGTSDSQRAEVSLGGIGEELQVEPDRGWMNVSIIDANTSSVSHVVMNQTLGAIVYEHDQTEIAYQGGGVWKRTPSGATMISPPEFHYRGTTLTLPLVTVGGGPINGGDLVINDPGLMQKKYPNQTAGLWNPVTEDQINVTVHSEFYEAWGRFFEQRTSGDVYYDDANQTVTIVLLVQTGSTSISGGIVSGAAGTTLNVPNRGGIDSYNSSVGSYSVTAAANTSVIVAGDVLVENQGEIQGDLVAGKDVTLENNALVTGNVSYGGGLFGSGTVNGWTAQNATVPQLASVQGLISLKANTYDSSNNNGIPEINNATNELVTGPSTWELPPGDYYLSELELGGGETLILNATGGNVSIVVRNDITMTNDAEIRVKGNETVRFFLQNSLDMGQQSKVTIPDQQAPQLWMYLTPSGSAVFGQDAQFMGVIYGPGPGNQPGAFIDLGQQTEIYGGLIGDVQAIPQKAAIHFDEALGETSPLAGQPSLPKVTYLHVTVSTVNASTSA